MDHNNKLFIVFIYLFLLIRLRPELCQPSSNLCVQLLRSHLLTRGNFYCRKEDYVFSRLPTQRSKGSWSWTFKQLCPGHRDRQRQLHTGAGKHLPLRRHNWLRHRGGHQDQREDKREKDIKHQSSSLLCRRSPDTWGMSLQFFKGSLISLNGSLYLLGFNLQCYNCQELPAFCQ